MSAEDEELALLEAYLAALQSGGRPSRDSILAARPELASALDCLEALERIAPREPPAEAAPAELAAGANGMAVRFPCRFGGYELLGEIGRGGMGVVYRARQAGLDRVVALKMIAGSYLASPESVRRFRQEALAAARLQHPHIVRIHEVGEVHGQHFFAMEYIEGESLAQRLARGRLAPMQAVRIVAAVARAVAQLHRQGIVHRDLKPSNVLLDADEQPYLTDFGLAKMALSDAEATTTGVIAGTPSYMSPEQAAGRGAEVGPAADIYSLGAILYECLTGQPPFRGATPLDTVLEVLDRDPQPPSQLVSKLPRPLEWLCLRCLAKSPAARYPTAAALADDLERFARQEPLEIQPPTLAERAWRWTRRRPALALRLGGLGAFYLYEWINVLAGWADVDWQFHWKISLWLAIWAGLSILFQRLVESRRWSTPACFGWGTLDTVMLLLIMLTADGAASPLVVAYPLLIVGSALWFHVRFVWFMTAMSLLSYGVLVADFYFRRTYLQQHFDIGIDRHVLFAVSLVVCGAVVAYVTHRIRALSNFYGDSW